MLQVIQNHLLFFFRQIQSFWFFARAAFAFPVWLPEFLRITWKYNLYYYNIFLFMPFFFFSTLKGKRILEVGGSDLPEELLFKKFKATSWTCLDYLDWWTDPDSSQTKGAVYPLKEASPELIAQKHVVFNGMIENLPDCFAGQYDSVVSICAMEHIPDLPKALEVIYNALKPGGEFYTCFAPVYSGDKGNHIFVETGPKQKKVVFNGIPRNGIPRWAHFLVQEKDLREKLLKLYPEEWVNTICDQCYHSDFINRKFYDEYIQIFKETPFENVKILNWFPSYITPSDKKRLREVCAPFKSFEWNGLIIYAKKAKGTK
ncbi:MAG: class I SAM-dependent methyltransferase [Thermoguttaceae bacterium]|nr:class I SAM-dependent methyltransferase [Thermoguttaceae bacterium]